MSVFHVGICPICFRTAFFEELFFDKYLFRILSSVSSLVSEVEIHPDGSWTVPMVSKYSNQSTPLGMDRCCVDGNSVENSSAASEIYLNPSNSLGNENQQVDSNRSPLENSFINSRNSEISHSDSIAMNVSDASGNYASNVDIRKDNTSEKIDEIRPNSSNIMSSPTIFEGLHSATSLGANMKFTIPEAFLERSRTCFICSKKEDTKQCSRCKRISYCGKPCQIRDWPRHREECFPMTWPNIKNSVVVPVVHTNESIRSGSFSQPIVLDDDD